MLNSSPLPHRLHTGLPLIALLLSALPTQAAPPMQNMEEVRLNIEAFLSRHSKTLPGSSTFSVARLEANASRPPCSRMQTTLAPGARAYGKTNVLVQCEEGASWRLYAPVQIDVIGSYIVSSRTIPQGQVLTNEDLGEQKGNLAELPITLVKSADEAIGRVAAIPIVAGTPIRGDQLRLVWVVQSGQQVRVSLRGSGFEVSTEGKALGSAAAGKTVQVRLNNGQLVSGTAQTGGWIEVRQ